MKKVSSAILCLATVAIACSSVQADIVAYSFENAPAPTQTVTSANLASSALFAPTTVDANVTATNTTVGAGLTGLTYVTNVMGNYFQASEGNGVSDGTDDDINGAFTAGDFIEFTVNANPGATLNLTDLTFDFGRAGNGTNDFALRSSVDGFANDVFFGDQAASTDQAGVLAPGSTLGQSVDLTGADFQGLSNITFRIAIDDRQSNTGGASATIFDDIILNGTVVTAVPEPSSLAVLGLGALGLLIRRRK